MCLSPKVIVNRSYYKLSGYDYSRSLALFGARPDYFVKVDCGSCFECQKKRGNNWRTRLLDEYKYYVRQFPQSKVHFCTLTIAPAFYDDFCASPNLYIRKFLERYRYHFKKSFKHWICSEYGTKKGRLHLHMIAFGALFDVAMLRQLWPYGRVDMQTLKGPQGLTYVSGYVTKIVKGDKMSKQNQPLFLPRDKRTYIWTSPRLGLGYSLDYVNRRYHNGNVFIRQRDNGSPFAIPRYYLDKLFSPIDLYRRKLRFFNDQFTLPKPPFKCLNNYFIDLADYFCKIRSLGGTPVILSTQFSLLSNSQKKSYFYGK